MAVTGTQTVPGVWPVVSVVAVVFGITAAAWAARWTALTDALAHIGRRTLPIYVIHMPLLALMHRLLIDALSGADEPVQMVLAIVEPLAAVAVVVVACLVLERGLRKAGAGWLFELPARRTTVGPTPQRLAAAGSR
jgi:peptidoglycan/LPS O-acetylase OafA/YrhL